MPSLLNTLILKETKSSFEANSAVVFVNYNTFTQSDSVAMREAAGAAGGTARVVKNAVSNVALKDLGVEGAESILKGPVLALFGNDPVAMSKVAADFSKKNKKGEPLGAVVDGAIVSTEDVMALSKLPSRDALVGMFVNVVAAPLRGLVTVLNGNIRGLAIALNAVKEKKEQEAA